MSQRGLPCRPCGPSCTTYSQRQVKERPSFWVRTGALHRTSQKVSLLPTHQMCGLGKHPAAWAASPGLSHSSVLDTTDQRPGHCCVRSDKHFTFWQFLCLRVAADPSPGDSHVMVLSSCFFGVCGVFCRSFTVLDCNRIAYLKTLRDLRCI